MRIIIKNQIEELERQLDNKREFKQNLIFSNQHGSKEYNAIVKECSDLGDAIRAMKTLIIK